MRLPGSLKALHSQLSEIGWGQPTCLTFDADGNLVGITLATSPAPSSPPAQEGRKVVEGPPKYRPSALQSLAMPFPKDEERVS